MDKFFGTSSVATSDTNKLNGNVNISDLFKKQEYKETLVKMRELVKPSEIIGIPVVITDYKEDTISDQYSKENKEKPCFRMDFYFEDDEAKENHYIRTEAKYLWDYLKTVDKVDPQLLRSGTVTATILRGEKKNGMMKTPFYYFKGTME